MNASQVLEQQVPLIRQNVLWIAFVFHWLYNFVTTQTPTIAKNLASYLLDISEVHLHL